MQDREILLSEFAGFCFGVKRAVELAEKKLFESKENSESIYSFGPLIHNPQVVKQLKEKGVKVIENIQEIKNNSSVIIRTHGIHPDIEEELKNKDITIVDVTCPFVRNVQNYAKQLKNEGYFIFLIGEKEHPEIKGILGYCGENSRVINSVQELFGIKIPQSVGVIAQTTQSITNFGEIVAYLSTIAKELKIFNTICWATEKRQQAAYKLAKVVDIMLVIGGKNSGNTRRLYEICKKVNNNTYHIETADELDNSWFTDKVKRVGITAGASTPDWIILEVIDRVKVI
ncbi:MAG: 4-hydroxy-3-methylbut-2-enyl diphosphate reductase [Candidatus Hydrogenedentota bacterium]